MLCKVWIPKTSDGEGLPVNPDDQVEGKPKVQAMFYRNRSQAEKVLCQGAFEQKSGEIRKDAEHNKPVTLSIEEVNFDFDEQAVEQRKLVPARDGKSAGLVATHAYVQHWDVSLDEEVKIPAVKAVQAPKKTSVIVSTLSAVVAGKR